MEKVFNIFHIEYIRLLNKYSMPTCSEEFLDNFLNSNSELVNIINCQIPNVQTKECLYRFYNILLKITGDKTIIFSEDRQIKTLGDLLNVLVLDANTIEKLLIPLIKQELIETESMQCLMMGG